MRDDFCIFILSHGRPDKVYTYHELLKSGYTGKVYIVIDDEDNTAAKYREVFGERVIQFSKAEVAAKFDEGDNFNDRRTIFYARNACFEIARRVGVKLFMQFDDDYFAFQLRYDRSIEWACIRVRRGFDEIVNAMIEFYESTPFASVAISQGGDHIGGGEGKRAGTKRKAMNSFLCSVDRPFEFVGRINEDVNTYTSSQRAGVLFLTIMQAQLVQKVTQSNSGGMTDVYLDSGTYLKTMYSVMYCPSAVRVAELGDHGAGGPREHQDSRVAAAAHYRIHHSIKWDNVAPCILREEHRKGGYP